MTQPSPKDMELKAAELLQRWLAAESTEEALSAIAEALTTVQAEAHGRAETERLREAAIVGGYMWTPAELQEAIEAEREACAIAAEAVTPLPCDGSEAAMTAGYGTQELIASAIRARKDQG